MYTIRSKFIQLGKPGGINSGDIQIEGFIELHDPDKHIPFAIANHFTKQRLLTGADFDIESMQRARDGTLWFGDEFGPFLLHTDANGKVLEPPIPLPDFDNPDQEIRSPQNPFNEEASAVRIMNAVRAHARAHGNHKTLVFSPWHVMLADGNPDTFIDNRSAPPEGSGLVPASSEIFDIASMQRAGYPIVTWTVNDKARMLELMQLGVKGIVSDRPDLLRQAVEEFDADGDGTPGDFLDAEGLVDIAKFDAQGHRGGRNLRRENTLPAMEVALDVLMSTLESDIGITADGVPVLDHDPHVQAVKCRFASDSTGTVYTDPGSDDGTNLQDEKGNNTPWFAELFWPYRVTTLDHPFRSQRSGGFEGMALSQDGNTLLPLLEKPLMGGEAQTLLIHEFDIASRSYTGTRFKYMLDPHGTAIGDFQLFGDRHGVIIERDETQGDRNDFKVIFEVELLGAAEPVQKTLAVDLMKLADPLEISTPGQPLDVGIAKTFAFPFVTIEDVVVLGRNVIGVINDNNFPFSVGRHVATGQPDDTEFIIILLERTLGTSLPAP